MFARPSRIVVARRNRRLLLQLLALWGFAAGKRRPVAFSLAHPRPPPSVVVGKAHPCEREKEKTHRKGVFFLFLVAGVGFEPHDLRVMRPTSYQAALPRDIMVPETGLEPARDLSLTGF